MPVETKTVTVREVIEGKTERTVEDPSIRFVGIYTQEPDMNVAFPRGKISSTIRAVSPGDVLKYSTSNGNGREIVEEIHTSDGRKLYPL